jgi:hypothetical protein
MAFTSGTASNYKDLLAIMTTFAAANGWSILEQTTNRVYLKGTGLAGTDEIFCGVETYEDTSNGYYNWELFGSVSWRSGREPHMHPLSSGDDKVFTYFWNAAIPYWMVANPRRIIVVAKVGTTYQFVHLGLGLPVGTDAQYPYPLLIGGCGTTKAQAYSVGNANIGAFWGAGYSGACCGRLRLPGGVWGSIGTTQSSALNPTLKSVCENFIQIANILNAPTGEYKPEQVYVVDLAAVNTYIGIDGIFRVSGYQQTAENIITVDGVNYMAFPDIYRVGNGDFCALRLN